MSTASHPNTTETLVFKTSHHWILFAAPAIVYGVLALFLWMMISSTSDTLLYCMRGHFCSLSPCSRQGLDPIPHN